MRSWRSDAVTGRSSTCCATSRWAISVLLLIVPVGLILWRTFQPGVGAFFESITTPAAVSALQLSLLVVAIVVPLNVLFGVPTALVLARNRFRGKSAAAGCDRPAVRGVTGRGRCRADPVVGFGRAVRVRREQTSASRSSSASPASCWPASSSPCRSSSARSNRSCTNWALIRRKPPRRWDRSWWQTFWRVTLPSIRWGLTYGIVLTVARTLGEFGAVIMVVVKSAGFFADADAIGGGQVQPWRRVRRIRRFHVADDGCGDRSDRSGDPRLPPREIGQLGLRRR